MIQDIDFGGSIVDKAFASEWTGEEVGARDGPAVISPHRGRIGCRGLGAEIYKCRHLIGNIFGTVREFKGVALRDCNTEGSFNIGPGHGNVSQLETNLNKP